MDMNGTTPVLNYVHILALQTITDYCIATAYRTLSCQSVNVLILSTNSMQMSKPATPPLKGALISYVRRLQFIDDCRFAAVIQSNA